MSLWGSATIDKNGIIYVGTPYDGLHAVYPNGTKKWQIDINGREFQAPAIAPDGTIYIGTMDWFYAFYPNGTLKWIFNIEGNFFCEPVVDSNGTVYVGTQEGFVYAIYSNGTLKWEYEVLDFVFYIALDKNENIYFNGIYKNKLFCLNQNGSLKWTYHEVSIWDGPVIGDDGTIYINAIHNLVALYPNGTRKWNINYSDFYGMPSITPDGTIILSTDGCKYITALNQSDASVIWQYKIGEDPLIGDVSYAAISGDGIIYFAYDAYSEEVAFLVALNPDGTLKWETSLTTDVRPYDFVCILSNPSIGSDGTIYITSWFGYHGYDPDIGYIHAIGMENPVSPESPNISGPSNVKLFKSYEYVINSNISTEGDVYYFIDWDDEEDDYIYGDNWIGPYTSGEDVKIKYTFKLPGSHKIKVRAKGNDSLCSPYSYFDLNVKSLSRSKYYNSNYLLRFLERYPLLNRLLQRLVCL